VRSLDANRKSRGEGTDLFLSRLVWRNSTRSRKSRLRIFPVQPDSHLSLEPCSDCPD
jgi:hypothetical protein